MALEAGVCQGLVVTQAWCRMGLEQAICALSAWTKDGNMSVRLLYLTCSSSLPPNTLIKPDILKSTRENLIKEGRRKQKQEKV